MARNHSLKHRPEDGIHVHHHRLLRAAGPALAAIALFLGGIAVASADAIAADAAGPERSRNSLRVLWAKSSESDLTTGVFGDFDASPESNYLLGASWGRHLSDTLFGLPFPMTANLGVQYFNERGYQDDALGATAFVKAHYTWRVPLTSKHVRLGLGEGLSYVSRVPLSEERDFAKKGVHSEKLLNYVEWTVDVPLQQFATFRPLMHGRLEELSIGFIIWHRSSVYGLFADTRGGVNFMGFGIEARF